MLLEQKIATWEVDTLFHEIALQPIDRVSIDQELLDLTHKERTSLFPWRGQFSPQLIELLLKEYARTNAAVLDPFVGSGTTLFEAARRYLTSYGAEINPAAFTMASTVHFVNVPLNERRDWLARAESLIRKFFRPDRDLFTWAEYLRIEDEPAVPFKEAVDNLFAEASFSPSLHTIVANTIMKYIDYEGNGNHRSISDAFRQYAKIVEKLPESQCQTSALLCDARALPFTEAEIDLVITSPPYINVFNYHQNYRRAMELMGWNLLRVAPSEIGSNRKHRSNRFLTVVQYAIDMYQTLRELQRLLKIDGRVIIVIGRESRVRGVSFDNPLILSSLAVAGAGFKLVQHQERKFTNRFGQIIYEDLLHLVPDSFLPNVDDRVARSIATAVLDRAASQESRADVLKDIAAAREQAHLVKASPIFHGQSARVTIV